MQIWAISYGSCKADLGTELCLMLFQGTDRECWQTGVVSIHLKSRFTLWNLMNQGLDSLAVFSTVIWRSASHTGIPILFTTCGGSACAHGTPIDLSSREYRGRALGLFPTGLAKFEIQNNEGKATPWFINLHRKCASERVNPMRNKALWTLRFLDGLQLKVQTLLVF
ncbi:no significant blast hit [Histoplasma capsulatum G186AR]|uniref:Uncharacterized protein n=1 Tax=Ajellomyces capsulatus TaxID=5037 RepID=A0A8H8D2W9_AJECA|nr:hypothetical protein I7I52_10050 [Histoplasma capsulatum]QSS67714.1 no significant blast hit [Histoplasma capsulatum G186AR]